MNPEPIIEINDLTTYLGGNFIHKSLNLTIYRNEILAVVGGSGSGKTTLLRSILMLLPLYSGTIKVFGHDIEHSSEATLKKIQQSWGVLFQHSALFSSLTTLENVMFPLQEKTGLPQNSIVELAKLKLNLVGFPLDSIHKYPAELSGGMQKRAGLARAIALDPELLFLDEPTTGLDPEGATSLDELVISLKNDLGLTIVIVTHDLDTLWSVADRVAFIGEKRVLEVSSMVELTQSEQPIIKEYFNDPRARTARHIREELRERTS